jgi:LysM repeat protein
MRKYLTRTHSLSTLTLCFALISSGCSITPEQDSKEEMVATEQNQATEVMEKQQTTPTVYEVDSAEDVQVDNLPTSPENNTASIKTSAPQEYIVQKGDTLWDISSQFLNQPWYWPEIWYMNPQVQNPHLIYPGDVINVVYVGGKPYLTVNGENRVSGIERLSPIMRGEPIEANEKIIPIQAIEQFLTRPLVIGANELDSSPHIVASRDNRIVYGSNDIVYLRDGSDLEVDALYNIYRPGTAFEHGETGEILGYEAIHVGDGKLTREGDPATLRINESLREVLRGDRVIKIEQVDVDSDFRPRAPNSDINGSIIYLYQAITQSGTYQVVVADVGSQQGIEKGHVLAINKSGRTVSDSYADKGQEESVTLPSERSADAIVYRVFDNLSYLFILDANRPVRNGDSVSNPL